MILREGWGRLGRRTLRLGMRGKDVSLLQRRLDELGFAPGDTDGVFGFLTKEALQEFQKAHRLKVDGVAGPQVMRSIRDSFANMRITHVAARGEALSDVAEACGVPLELIMRANRLNSPDEIYKGLRLTIPIRSILGLGITYGETYRASYESLLRRSDYLTMVSLCWFRLSLEGKLSARVACGRGHPDGYRKIIEFGRLQGVKVLLGIGGLEAGVPGPGKPRMLAARNINDLMVRLKYDGVHVDLHNMPAGIREGAVSFLQDLKRKTCYRSGWGGQSGRFLVVSLPIRPEPFYEGIGEIADQVVLEACDEYPEGGPPEPAISPDWVKDAIRGALAYIPCWKILLGIATCDREKFELASRFNLGGIAIVGLGQEDPDIWKTIGSWFKVRRWSRP